MRHPRGLKRLQEAPKGPNSGPTRLQNCPQEAPKKGPPRNPNGHPVGFIPTTYAQRREGYSIERSP
eukprot:6323252-Pyramimonas_sp.AAC.1